MLTLAACMDFRPLLPPWKRPYASQVLLKLRFQVQEGMWALRVAPAAMWGGAGWMSGQVTRFPTYSSTLRSGTRQECPFAQSCQEMRGRVVLPGSVSYTHLTLPTNREV